MKDDTTLDKTTNNRPRDVKCDNVVERVVRQLNAICKDATFDFALAVGKLIVDSFYAGDLAAWRGRGVKNVSFRKLAKHPALPMSAAALYRSTAIYELCQRLGIEAWKHVSTSHLRLVLPLPAGEQAGLLRHAEEDGWPVQRLREEIETLSLVVPNTRGGRRRRSRLRRTLRKIEVCLDESNRFLEVSKAGDDLSPESARSIVQLLQSVQAACTALEGRVSRSVQGVLGNATERISGDGADEDV